MKALRSRPIWTGRMWVNGSELSLSRMWFCSEPQTKEKSSWTPRREFLRRLSTERTISRRELLFTWSTWPQCASFYKEFKASTRKALTCTFPNTASAPTLSSTMTKASQRTHSLRCVPARFSSALQELATDVSCSNWIRKTTHSCLKNQRQHYPNLGSIPQLVIYSGCTTKWIYSSRLLLAQLLLKAKATNRMRKLSENTQWVSAKVKPMSR